MDANAHHLEIGFEKSDALARKLYIKLLSRKKSYNRAALATSKINVDFNINELGQ